jgi:hypothetical protein
MAIPKHISIYNGLQFSLRFGVFVGSFDIDYIIIFYNVYSNDNLPQIIHRAQKL